MTSPKSPMRKELLRRRCSQTSTSDPNLLPCAAPHVPQNSLRHVPSAPQSQHSFTSKDSSTRHTIENDFADLKVDVSISLPVQSTSNNPFQPSPQTHSVPTRRLRSPMQMKLLQERNRKSISSVNISSRCGFQSPSMQREGQTCTSSLELPSASTVSTITERNLVTRRPSLSPAMTTFKPPLTTNYSTALRRRKALLVGIGYQGHRFLRPLPGCRNDVRNIFTLLTSPLFGFPRDNIRILCDELESVDGIKCSMPTRINILRLLNWLTVDIVCGDSVVFFFAGHGDFVEDLSGDEVESGFDQVSWYFRYLPFIKTGITIDESDWNSMGPRDVH